jgi:tetratricopeptide (TPR) repeat protein
VRLTAKDPTVERIPGVRKGVVFRCIALIALFIALGAVLEARVEPAVVASLCAVLVLLMAWCVQGLWLERLVGSPGPILVRELSGPADNPDVDVPQLGAAFRRRLMKLRLQAPTPVPGAIPQQDFLATLSTRGLESKDPLASSLSLLRASLPTCAYEVSAALVEQRPSPGGPRWGVRAQVRLPHEVIPVQTAWASSPQAAALMSADIVTAAVLPRTKLSNRPPWSGWRGYVMPSLLVHHFERAEELTSQRRYDEALDSYFSALELDPKSVDLRLHMGYVQEKLGLYLDAVATYAAARKMADDTSRALYGGRAKRNRKASGRIASYRLAVLLGGVNVAHQWRNSHTTTSDDREPARGNHGKRRNRREIATGDRDHSRPTQAKRCEQRSRLRKCLSPELTEMLKAHKLINERRSIGVRAKEWLVSAAWGRPISPHRGGVEGPPPWHKEKIEELLTDSAPTGISDDAHDPGYYRLRNVLGHLALEELTKVRVRVRRPGRSRAVLAPLTVKLTMECVDLRLGWIRHRLGNDGAARPWTPDVMERIKNSAVRSRLTHGDPPFRTWAQHYNAACLCALPLLVTELDKLTKDELADEAVKHLARAVCGSTSQYVADRRDWLLSEDPDLEFLRNRREFKHFEVIHFPSASRTPWRPTKVRRWEQSRYTNELIIKTARCWEAVWHQRRDKLLRGIDPHVTLDWFVDEAQAWASMKALTGDYRHWEVRFELIDKMNQWSSRYEFDQLKVTVPCFTSSPSSIEKEVNKCTDDELAAAADRAIDDDIERNKERLTEVDAIILAMTSGCQPHPPIQQLQTELRDRDFWHREAPRLYLTCVSDVHAAMWQRLHEWLEAEPDAEKAAESAFRTAMKQEGRLRSTSSGLWMLWLLDRRVVPGAWHDPLRGFKRNGTRSHDSLHDPSLEART